jgi:3-oxoacyl-[acyl-carrier protein] reductase
MQRNGQKTALVTGATKGMGRSIVGMLAAEGYHLFITARSEADLMDLKRNLLEAHPGVIVHHAVCDCADQQQVAALIRAVDEVFAQLDVLVNNVGIYRQVSLLEETLTDFELQWQVNFRTAYTLSRHFGKKMRDLGSGHIFHISSVASRKPVAAAGSYTVTKYALAGLNAVLRTELGAYGVKVTEIIPGATLTASWEGVDVQEDRFVAADDIAVAIRACLQMSGGANIEEIVLKPVAD